MRWLRHRKARSDRDAGLAFAWRTPVSRLGTTLAGLLLVGSAAAMLASAVKVRVLSPPARSEQRGSLIMTADADLAAWLERQGAELTPFPARLDVAGLELTRQALAGHPALTGTIAVDYVPRLRELGSAHDQAEPVARVGERELPPLPPLRTVPESAGKAAPAGVKVPVLSPDSPALAARVPVPLPPFDAVAAEELPVANLRFLLELDAFGRVRSVVPLAAGGSKAVEHVERWLRGVGFEPVAGGVGWFAVAVSFVSGGND